MIPRHVEMLMRKKGRIDDGMRCISESAILSQSRSLSRIFTALSPKRLLDLCPATILREHSGKERKA